MGVIVWTFTPSFSYGTGSQTQVLPFPTGPSFQPRTAFLILLTDLHQLMSWDNLGCWEMISNACKFFACYSGSLDYLSFAFFHIGMRELFRTVLDTMDSFQLSFVFPPYFLMVYNFSCEYLYLSFKSDSLTQLRKWFLIIFYPNQPFS